MKLNRKWIMVLALVMSMAMATTGTLAYLTDRDSEANVFTMGNVDIELNEEFDQGSELIPGVDIEKKPTITNTGKNTAWVWATIAIPSALDDVNDASQNIVHFNFTEESVADGEWQWTDENNQYMVKTDVEIDGVKYNVYTALYETPLQPGETTATPVISKVYMDDHIDIDPEGNVYHVLNGVADKKEWNINTNGNPIIYVSAYAIQEEGFKTVQDAYAAYNTQWGENGGAEYAYTSVTTAEEMMKAINAGQSVKLMNDIEITERIDIPTGTEIVLNLNGKTITDNRDGMTGWVQPGAKLTIMGNGAVVKSNHNENMFYYDGELNIVDGTFKYTEYTWGECTSCAHGTNPLKVGCLFVGRADEAKGYEGALTVKGGTFDSGVKNPDKFTTGNGKNVVMFAMLNNHGTYPSEMVVYGGTYVAANPANGDANAPYTLYLEGQTVAGELPEGYSIVDSTLSDGRTAYTVNYSK